MLASGVVNVTTMVRCCDVAANTPQAGVLVVAVNADGMLAGTATTDAQGQATLTIAEGAYVTAIYPEDVNNENYIVTYAGVKPNDNLTFGDGYYTPNQTINGTAGNLTLNWSAVTGATQYQVYHPCESYGRYVGSVLTYQVPLYTYCQTATAPIAVLALDANYNPVASRYLPAANYAPAGTIDIAANDWVMQAIDNLTTSISGLPAAVYEADFDVMARYDGFSYNESDYMTPKSGSASATFTTPSTALSATVQARLYRNNYARQEHYKGGASPVVFAPPTLPWISGVIFDLEALQAIWLQTAGTYDASYLDLDWRRTEPKGPDHYYYWRVILPPGVTTFSVGTPPTELAPYVPTATDESLDAELTLVDLSSAASYDAARALPEWRLAQPDQAVMAGEEPSAGITRYFDGGEGFTDFR